MKNRFISRSAALAVGAILVFAAPLTAQAETTTDEMELVSTSVTDMPDGSWVDERGYTRLTPDALRELAAEQSPAEVKDVLLAGGPLNLLVDDGGEVLAAAPAEHSQYTQRAISTCFSGGTIVKRYLGGKSANSCYQGVGEMNVNLPSVYYVATGGYNVSLYISGGRIPSSTISWNTSSLTYNTPVNVYKIQRWARG